MGVTYERRPIILYTTENCRIGELTREILQDILDNGNFQCCLKQIDIGSNDTPSYIHESPTVDLGWTQVSGIPDESILRNELQKFVLRESLYPDE